MACSNMSWSVYLIPRRWCPFRGISTYLDVDRLLAISALDSVLDDRIFGKGFVENCQSV
jgi:hypothetical protein